MRVYKSTINEGTTQKTTCELKSAVNIESISLLPPKSYQYNQIRFYLGGGISFSGEEVLTAPNAQDVDTYQYN